MIPVLRPVAPDVRETTEIGRYLKWLEDRGHTFDGYAALHRWSVTDLDGFWSSIKDFFGVRFHTPVTAVVPDRRMPGTEWFPGAKP